MALFLRSLLIVFISITTALLGEGFTWLTVYRTNSYKRLKAEVDRSGRRLEKKKEAVGQLADKHQKKKLGREEERIRTLKKDLSLAKTKSMMFVGLAFTFFLTMCNNIFYGKVVAKLPFLPPSFLQGLSHRSLKGDDYTDCSFIFLYIICTMSTRANVQRLLGFAPTRTNLDQEYLSLKPS